MTYPRIFNKNNTMGTANSAGTAHHPGSTWVYPCCLLVVRVALSLVFYIVLCRPMFVFFVTFSFGHCIIFLLSFKTFGNSFWYLQTCLVLCDLPMEVQKGHIIKRSFTVWSFGSELRTFLFCFIYFVCCYVVHALNSYGSSKKLGECSPRVR